MLHNIQIQNFRCFENFKADGFERINLIGGKNNIGKTCMLEAIAVFSKSFNQQALFDLRSKGMQSVIFKKAQSNLLFVKTNYNSNEVKFEMQFRGVSIIRIAEPSLKFNINFITQKNALPPLKILESFDEFDAKLLKDKLISILKIVDSRIEDMRTFKTKEGLYIKPVNEEYEPLNNFGDATVNLIRYFTPVFEKELYPQKGNVFSILVIDEIDNGLHYTAHYSFWKNIFSLARELNIQLFATTHSLEMIKQFNRVCLEEGQGAYFEMGREYETGKIFAEKHDAEMLQYELLKEESTFRGE